MRYLSFLAMLVLLLGSNSCNKEGLRRGDLNCYLAEIRSSGYLNQTVQVTRDRIVPLKLSYTDGSYTNIQAKAVGTWDWSNTQYLIVEKMESYRVGANTPHRSIAYSYLGAGQTIRYYETAVSFNEPVAQLNYHHIDGLTRGVEKRSGINPFDLRLRPAVRFDYEYNEAKLLRTLFERHYESDEWVLKRELSFEYGQNDNPMKRTDPFIFIISDALRENAELLYPLRYSDQEITAITVDGQRFPIYYEVNEAGRLSSVDIPYFNIRESYVYTCW